MNRYILKVLAIKYYALKRKALMKKGIILLCSCAITLLCFCSDNPSGSTPDPTRNCFRKYPYTATSASIEVIEDSSFCIGIDLNHKFDTVYSGYNVTQTDLDVDTYDTLSSAIVRHTQTYTRVQTGSDLEGWWELTERNVSLVSGTLTTEELEKLDDDTAFVNSMMTEGALQIEITADTVYYYYVGSIADFLLSLYTKQIEGLDFARYLAVKTAKYSDNQITVTGHITGEVVTITSDEKFNQTVSSSNPAHETYTEYVRIEDCPIDDPLDWYWEFIMDNPSYAQYYIEALDSSGFSDSVDADIEKVDDTIVTITGNNSGEVITVTLHTDSTIVYESSDPTHTKYETTWAELGTPDWILVFIIENPVIRRKNCINGY